jgi:hypothetical protein
MHAVDPSAIIYYHYNKVKREFGLPVHAESHLQVTHSAGTFGHQRSLKYIYYDERL